MGEMVTLEKDATSLLSDAAEELTFSAGEEVERKLSERKEEKKDKGVSQVQFYVDHYGDMSRSDLEKLLKQIASIGISRNADLLALVRRTFQDPTNQHAALAYAEENLAGLDLPEREKAVLRENLRGALRELEAEEGRAINAGYNIAGIDAPDLGLSSSSLRILYRDVVIDFASYEKTFLLLLEKFGPEDFSKAAQYLIRALGGDMSAMTPSSPPAALKEVMDGLYMAASLGTLYSGARDMLQAAERHHGPHAVTEQSILKPLLRYAGLPMLPPGQVRADMPFLMTDNPARDAELAQGVRELARKAPHKLYLSFNARQNVLDCLQELLDNAADREEAALEE